MYASLRRSDMGNCCPPPSFRGCRRWSTRYVAGNRRIIFLDSIQKCGLWVMAFPTTETATVPVEYLMEDASGEWARTAAPPVCIRNVPESGCCRYSSERCGNAVNSALVRYRGRDVPKNCGVDTSRISSWPGIHWIPVCTAVARSTACCCCWVLPDRNKRDIKGPLASCKPVAQLSCTNGFRFNHSPFQSVAIFVTPSASA